MIGATLFSGIGAPEVACPWFQWAWAAEIDRFASAVHAIRIGTPNLGDVTAHDFADRAAAIARPDIIVFGSPCQSFSVAGKRLGLDDPRGNLALVALGILARLRPRWFIFENVPGLLSSANGRDFGLFLRALDELGYPVAWTMLDAQFFNVAQRRERVFVVGHLGDWRRAAAVLFEPEGMRGDPAPRREAGRGVARDTAPCLGASGKGFERAGDPRGQDCLIASHDPACTLTARDCKGPLPKADLSTVIAHSLRADGFDASEDGTGRGTPIVPLFAAGHHGDNGAGIGREGDPAFTVDTTGGQAIAFSCKDHGADVGETAPTLRAMGHDGSHANAGGQLAVAHPYTLAVRGRGDGHNLEYRQDGTANAILTPNGGRAGIGVGAFASPWAVRRLTPEECEALQGFPRGFTLVPYRGKPAADGPRYKALGNSMAVPVLAWIGRRIALCDEVLARAA